MTTSRERSSTTGIRPDSPTRDPIRVLLARKGVPERDLDLAIARVGASIYRQAVMSEVDHDRLSAVDEG